MALSPGVLYRALLQNRTTGPHPLMGVSYETLALGIATGVCQWGISQPSNLALAGVSTGTAGSGVVGGISRIIVPPTTSVLVAALSGAGIVGPLMSSLATAVTLGISQSFSLSGTYTGTSAGVGVGTDASKIVVANSATLIGVLNQTLSASMGRGPALPMLVVGLGNGIAALLLLGTGTAVVSGATTAPTATVGATTSVVV